LEAWVAPIAALAGQPRKRGILLLLFFLLVFLFLAVHVLRHCRSVGRYDFANALGKHSGKHSRKEEKEEGEDEDDVPASDAAVLELEDESSSSGSE
jgi:hypothetical protein